MTVRRYSSISQETSLVSALNTTATTMVVNSAAVLGSITPGTGERFTLVIDPDTALEEIVYAVSPTSPSSTTITIIRGVDGTGVEGTSGIAHSAGAKVRHMAIAVDFREANNHIKNETTAHGLTIANVLETTDTNMITTAMLQSNAVTTAKITDLNVTTGKLADNAVTTAKIADVNVTTAKIADLNVTTGKIADSAITSAKIADLTIATGDIADSAITSAKIADGTIVAGDIADGAITTGKILDGTIVNADVNTSAQIAYGKLALTNGIVNADINASAAIDKTKISGTAITAGDTGTVTSTMIADGAIVNADINASAAIEWTKIAPSSTVSATELGYLDGVTSAVQTQLDSKLATSTAASTYAPLANPALTGVPTAPTATAGTNTTQVATTAFVGTAVSNLVAAAPAALDTLNELAASLGNDANFATTVTNNLATKLPLAGGTMSGAIAMGTNKITGLGTPTTTGDAATKDYADTKLALTGGTLSGALAMGTNKITGLGDPTSAQDAATKNYIDTIVLAPSNLTGPITSVGNVTSIASQTGTGTKFVVDTSPTLVTPVLGVATATSINGTTIPTSKTLVATDSTAFVVPSQSGNSGKFLTTDGTTSSWGIVPASGVSTSGGDTITVASGTTVPLTIQNNGTGDSFVVNDVASDSTPFVIGADGLILAGSSTAYNSVGAYQPGVSNFGQSGTIGQYRYSADAAGTELTFNKSRSATLGTHTAVASGDAISILRFAGSDGTSFTEATRIIGAVDGTVSTGVVPGRIVFSTASSAGTLTERMRIDSAGRVGIGASPGTTTLLSVAGTPISASANLNITRAFPTISSSITGSVIIYDSVPTTQAAAFTVTELNHFRAIPTTIGAGSAITTEVGYRSTINSGSGKYGIYFDGTAPNYFAGRTGIGTTLTSGAMAMINNTTASDVTLVVRGASAQTGNNLDIQDSGNSPLLSVTSAGKVGIGAFSPAGKFHTVLATGFTAGNPWSTNSAVFATGGTSTSGGLGIAYDDTLGANLSSIVPGVAWKPFAVNASTVSLNYAGAIPGLTINGSGRVTVPGIFEAPYFITQAAGTYTFALIDAGKLIEGTGATAYSFTVPPNSSVAFPKGTQINILQAGAGQITIAPGAGVTINGTPGLKLRAQWSSATLIKRDTGDTWVLIGDIVA